MLKWRDFTARKEDESCHYIMPNHVLYQIVNEMPTTKNELRDCWRSTQGQGNILKYQDDVLAIVKRKIESNKLKKDSKSHKAKNNHIVLENTIKAARNPEARPQINSFELEQGKLPEYKVRITNAKKQKLSSLSYSPATVSSNKMELNMKGQLDVFKVLMNVQGFRCSQAIKQQKKDNMEQVEANIVEEDDDKVQKVV